MQTTEPVPHTASRPLGLHFVIDIVNAADPNASWSKLAVKHGDASLGNTRTDTGDLAASVTRIRNVLHLDNTAAAARSLNAGLALHPTHTELVELADARWAIRPALPGGADAAEAFLVIATFALGTWLAERGRCAWGICAAEGCTTAFIDEGRRTPQRFCSTTCATRTRVAAHRKSAGGQRAQAPPTATATASSPS